MLNWTSLSLRGCRSRGSCLWKYSWFQLRCCWTRWLVTLWLYCWISALVLLSTIYVSHRGQVLWSLSHVSKQLLWKWWLHLVLIDGNWFILAKQIEHTSDSSPALCFFMLFLFLFNFVLFNLLFFFFNLVFVLFNLIFTNFLFPVMRVLFPTSLSKAPQGFVSRGPVAVYPRRKDPGTRIIIGNWKGVIIMVIDSNNQSNLVLLSRCPEVLLCCCSKFYISCRFGGEKRSFLSFMRFYISCRFRGLKWPLYVVSEVLHFLSFRRFKMTIRVVSEVLHFVSIPIKTHQSRQRSSSYIFSSGTLSLHKCHKFS